MRCRIWEFCSSNSSLETLTTANDRKRKKCRAHFTGSIGCIYICLSLVFRKCLCGKSKFFSNRHQKNCRVNTIVLNFLQMRDFCTHFRSCSCTVDEVVVWVGDPEGGNSTADQ